LADGTLLRRYRCVMPSVEVVVSTPPSRGPKPKKPAKVELEDIILAPTVHSFSVHPDQVPPPKFSPVKCPLHPISRVSRWGAGRKSSTRHQRYKCVPGGDEPTHTFTPSLPRSRVAPDVQWCDADAVKNPHRGPTASARGQTFTTDVVAEGLQQLSLGVSYAKVGAWASAFKPVRRRDPALVEKRITTIKERRKKKGSRTATAKERNSRNHWQTAADWVEMFSPVLWSAWQVELSNEPRRKMPRVLVLDDLPLFGGPAPSGRKRSAMVFSVLVATEYYQDDPLARTYRQRVRLIRAYPTHNAEAYELLVLDSGVVPDVIVSDSATGILKMVTRLRKSNPELVWAPSAYHVGAQLERRLAAMKWGRPAQRFIPGDLADRLSNYSFISSTSEWERWWRDLDARALAQGVPDAVIPRAWRRRYYEMIRSALIYLDKHPAVPRGTGSVEANIRGQVKPFFEPRASSFTNIERTNRAADLLTLRLNKRMDDKRKVAAILRADAEQSDGFAPAARSITEPKGARLLRDPEVVASSLVEMRKQALATKKKST